MIGPKQNHLLFTCLKTTYLNITLSNWANPSFGKSESVDVKQYCLLAELEKFAPHVMVSASVLFEEKSAEFHWWKAKVVANILWQLLNVIH